MEPSTQYILAGLLTVLDSKQATQMFSVQVQNLSDIFLDYGQIWMLFFLLPHPKPLWRTEVCIKAVA
uniref:Secreted protein n=1 Tax=Heterorhabditis bacteriophora TaxID=37862 RepID=A0A1I7WBY4_HETBA